MYPVDILDKALQFGEHTAIIKNRLKPISSGKNYTAYC